MRWLDGVTDSMEVRLGKFWKLVMDREAWRAESPFRVPNSSPPQPRTYSRSGQPLLGLPPRTCQGQSLEGSESRSEGGAAKTKAWTPQEAPLQSPVLMSAPPIPAGPIRQPHGRHADVLSDLRVSDEGSTLPSDLCIQ